jgi:hypothetical protein
MSPIARPANPGFQIRSRPTPPGLRWSQAAHRLAAGSGGSAVAMQDDGGPLLGCVELADDHVLDVGVQQVAPCRRRPHRQVSWPVPAGRPARAGDTRPGHGGPSAATTTCAWRSLRLGCSEDASVTLSYSEISHRDPEALSSTWGSPCRVGRASQEPLRAPQKPHNSATRSPDPTGTPRMKWHIPVRL